MKKLKISALFMAVLLVSVAFVPAVSAQAGSQNQTAGGHPTLKDGVCFGPPARLLGDR
ncbi:hypothetical protein [Methanosarcina mazei]|uniref:hypothetical protein n=1 Tax=Methanosarcina mazei TaxID=2209 RepID=UPI000AA6C015|nr:hypothetical protein [Methanosarcina mazei]UWJ21820.1 Transporter [Methanosarcina mazei TMA]BBL66598.1 hypothetical protein MmazTMA_35750 [Methanosarcina mazei]